MTEGLNRNYPMHKVVFVIESCETREQFHAAWEYANLYMIGHGHWQRKGLLRFANRQYWRLRRSYQDDMSVLWFSLCRKYRELFS